MKLAIVVGQVVSTIKCKGWLAYPLLLVEYLTSDGAPNGVREVAADPIGAANGEWVLLVSGSSARMATSEPGPVDLCIVGIVDEVTLEGKAVFSK
jgi:ethanolamine utilization protein EutN